MEGRLHVGEWARKSQGWLPSLYFKGWSFVLFGISKKGVHWAAAIPLADI